MAKVRGLPRNFSLQLDVSPEPQAGISKSPPWISGIQRKLPITEIGTTTHLVAQAGGNLDTLFLNT